jgi:Spy/CpxP family protein refolding chaperone
MKYTRKFLFAILILATAGGITLAQRGQGRQIDPEKRAEKQTAMMAEKLALTPEQTEKVRSLNLRFAEQRKDVRGKMEGERKAGFDAMNKMRTGKQAALKEILTDEQFAQLSKMHDEKGGRGKGKMGHHGGRDFANPEGRGAANMERMTKDLSLTPAQVDKVKAINKDFAGKHQALREESEGNRKAMKDMRSEKMAALKEVLTPAQFDSLQKRMDSRMNHRHGKLRQNDERM